MKVLWSLALVAIAAVAYAVWPRSAGEASAAGGAIVAVAMPALSVDETRGQAAFAVRCAACHGADAGGIDGAGPPLIHKIYEPGHHGDRSIAIAALRGVRAHHWPFGDMPPVEGITEAEIAVIIGFLRKVQRANGIT